MQIASLFSSRTVRILAILIIVGGVIAVAPSLVSPAQSCPSEPPRPLRELYVRSDVIVVARVGKTEIVPVEKESADADADDSGYETTLLKTALHVSSTLKGEHEPVVYVNHYIYGDYKDKLSSVADDANLLVFLIRDPEMDGYFLDMGYGLKELSDTDLKVYISRIEELASIMKSGTPSDAEIVEWLVRCTEESATRWEGGYELATSYWMLEAPPVENAPPDTEEISEDQAAETPVENGGVDEINIRDTLYGYRTSPKAEFAKLLTKEQTYRLTTALLNDEALDSGDYYLLELVQRWDDPRLVPYLLAQLDLLSKPTGDREPMPAYIAENVMTIVADKLGDDALKALVKRISIYGYEESETYEDDEEPSEDNEDAAEVSDEQQAADDAAAAQRRNAELQHFVTLALSTVPKATTTEGSNPAVSPEP